MCFLFSFPARFTYYMGMYFIGVRQEGSRNECRVASPSTRARAVPATGACNVLRASLGRKVPALS